MAYEINPDAFVRRAQVITPRLELLEKNKRSEDKFRLIVNSAADLICTVKNRQITFINYGCLMAAFKTFVQ